MEKTTAILLPLAVTILLSATANFAQPAPGSGREAAAGTESINYKPFRDFAALYVEKLRKRQIDPDAPFKIEVTATLGENGRLTKALVSREPGGDPEMSDVAADAINALGDSSLLRVFYVLGARDVTITAAQDPDGFRASLRAELPTERDAARMCEGMNLAFQLVKTLRKGTDEAFLTEKIRPDSQGNVYTVNFQISRAEKNRLLEKHLRNYAGEN